MRRWLPFLSNYPASFVLNHLRGIFEQPGHRLEISELVQRPDSSGSNKRIVVLCAFVNQGEISWVSRVGKHDESIARHVGTTAAFKNAP